MIKISFFSVTVAACVGLTAMPVYASQWGCEVLLCLASPASPTQFPACVPPITRLWDALSHFPPDPFPTCDFEDGNDGSSYAKQLTTPFDPCEAGLSEVPAGTSVAEGKMSGSRSYGMWGMSSYSFTITQADQVSEPRCYSDDSGYSTCSYGSFLPIYGQKACVGKFEGAYNEDCSYEGGCRKSVNVYDKVVWQKAQSPRSIDVYVGSKFYRRVHW